VNDAVHIWDIATAVPPRTVSQPAALAFMLRHLNVNRAQSAVLRRVYGASAIERRHTVLDDFVREREAFTFFGRGEGMQPQPTTARRNAEYARHANVLAVAAARRLIEQAGIAPGTITHLVTASCTGFAAPGFDCRVVEEAGLSPTVPRLHIGFMGCFAAFPALRTAAHICASTPGARVLVVALELCTLHFTTNADPESLVTNSLFSDGAAAALVCAGPPPASRPALALRRFGTLLLPAAAAELTWMVGDHGFTMGLTQEVPRLIERNIRGVFETQCRDGGVAPADVRHWAVHPGGRAILDRSAAALGLEREQLGASYRVLREHGNMSAATILFVLREILQSDPGMVFAVAFGPGLTVESALLERV
jgi:predicted naringenin-chalcone synthase